MLYREISKIFREMSIELASRRPGGRIFSSAAFYRDSTYMYQHIYVVCIGQSIYLIINLFICRMYIPLSRVSD